MTGSKSNQAGAQRPLPARNVATVGTVTVALLPVATEMKPLSQTSSEVVCAGPLGVGYLIGNGVAKLATELLVRFSFVAAAVGVYSVPVPFWNGPTL
jgi:hypothetical protein